LVFTRVCAFIFFLGVGVAYNTVDSGGDFDLKYFTNWNVLLITLYFTVALSCCLIACCTTKPQAYQKRSQLSTIVLLLFEVAGSTAPLITVVNFTLLEDAMSLMNVTCHLVTSCCLLAEMLLNKLTVNFEHYPFVLAWFVAYMVTIWPLVLTGRVSEWPYPFLALDDWDCFFWYSGLIVASLFFYSFWYWVSVLKCRFHAFIEQRSVLKAQAEIEDLSVAFLEQVHPYANTNSRSVRRPSALV